MSSLNTFIKIVAFDDEIQTNGPKLKAVDWNRDTIIGVPVDAPANNKYYIPALASKSIFSGTAWLNYDATTQFSVSLSPLSSSTYRLTWVGGTDPAFRTARTVAFGTGHTVTITVQANQTAVVTSTATSVFTNVQVGDDVFIPGVSTGDTALFDPLNEGHWVVLAASASQLTLVRETGVVFEAKTETVTITANNQFLAFSSDGVQVDSMVAFLSGFSSSLLHTYPIVTVTSTFIEFTSSAPLPSQTVTPGEGSLAVFSEAKRMVYIETDQEIGIAINGAPVTSVQPLLANNASYPGIFAATAVIYSLDITNNSTQQATVRVITAE